MEKYCGVYKITNIKNGKFYIGSSIDIHTRWKQHINQLNKNIHNNIHLQNAWNKYGKNAFLFEILEECDKNNLRDLEQTYIDNTKCLDKKIGYNIAPKTDMTEISDETKDKISNTLKGKFVGENCFYSRYSEEKIKTIIKDLMDINLSYNKIAQKNHVSKSVVCNIYYGNSWAYLTKNIKFPKRHPCGNSLNILTENDIPEIVGYFYNGYSDTEIGKIYSVNRKTISDIRKHKTWKKLTQDLDFPKSNGQKKGSENNNSKLTISQVQDIKRLINQLSVTKIADIYGVSHTSISNIKNGKIYSYV